MKQEKQGKKINLICGERLKKYFAITEKALNEAKKHPNKDKKQDAEEILKMASCYVEDARYFEKQGHYVNAFAALNYAHGWLDTGAILGIFYVNDSNLFVIK
jgi:hypothetical protein